MNTNWKIPKNLQLIKIQIVHILYLKIAHVKFAGATYGVNTI